MRNKAFTTKFHVSFVFIVTFILRARNMAGKNIENARYYIRCCAIFIPPLCNESFTPKFRVKFFFYHRFYFTAQRYTGEYMNTVYFVLYTVLSYNLITESSEAASLYKKNIFLIITRIVYLYLDEENRSFVEETFGISIFIITYKLYPYHASTKKPNTSHFIYPIRYCYITRYTIEMFITHLFFIAYKLYPYIPSIK